MTNDKQVKALIRKGIPGRHAIDNGLYLRITTKGTPLWVIRYAIHGKRREITVGTYPQMTLSKARADTTLIKEDVKRGFDPLAERARIAAVIFKTIDDLAEDWLKDCERRLKHPNIPRRVYEKDIAPSIGSLPIGQVNPRDIRAIISKIATSGRPTVANDALGYCKQLFRHGVKLDVIRSNPAEAFGVMDAGGIEKSRDRALSTGELADVFACLRNNKDQFARENYLAVALLVIVGCRKGELIAAQWNEFDMDAAIWRIPGERTKTGASLNVPLPDVVIGWFEELHLRACGSEFVFPNRRSSKRSHISPDTINAALQKLFREDRMSVKHFTVHDLRRTCRSLLAEAGVAPNVAERCLNHKIKGVEGIYDRHDYLDERRTALERISTWVSPIVTPETNVISFKRRGA